MGKVLKPGSNPRVSRRAFVRLRPLRCASSPRPCSRPFAS